MTSSFVASLQPFSLSLFLALSLSLRRSDTTPFDKFPLSRTRAHKLKHTYTYTQDNTACLQCMLPTSTAAAEAWQECFEGYYSTGEGKEEETGSMCAAAMAMTCCNIQVSPNFACLASESFLNYAECYVGTECLPLTCSGVVSAADLDSGASRRLSSSPMGVVGSGGGGGEAATTAATVALTMVFGFAACNLAGVT